MHPKRELRIRKVDKGLGQGKEEAETRKDTEKHGRKNTSFRAGCVSDGINILFGEGPFGKLRDRVSVRSVSLSNWPLLVARGPRNPCGVLALP